MRVFVSEPDWRTGGRAPLIPCQKVLGPGEENCREEGSGPLVPQLLLPLYSSPFTLPSFYLPKPLSGKVGLTELNSLQLALGQDASHVF